MKLRTTLATGTVDVLGVKVHVQNITPDEVQKFRKKHTEYTGRGVSRRMEFNDIAFARDVFMHQITGWEGAEDENGPLECNDSSKTLVYNFDQDFVKQVTEKSKELFDSREEEDGKN